MDELPGPADEWIPGESFTCLSGNEIRQALLLAIWRDIQAGVPTGVLEKWMEAACTWPLLLRVMDKRCMLVECASLHHRRASEAVEYTAPQQLQLLHHCVAQKRAESPDATAKDLHIHYKSTDSLRRPGSKIAKLFIEFFFCVNCRIFFFFFFYFLSIHFMFPLIFFSFFN